MDGSSQPNGGFPPHVQEQLRQAAMVVPLPQPGRGRGQNRRGRNNFYPLDQSQFYGPSMRNANMPQHPQYVQHPGPQSRRNQHVTNPTDINSFPPLGSNRQPVAPVQQHYQPPMPPQIQSPSNQPQLPPQVQPLSNQPTTTLPTGQPIPNQRQDYLPRGRGRGRGGPYRGRGGYGSNDQHQFQGQNPVNADDFQRANPAPRRQFTPGPNPHFNSLEEQRAYQRKIIDQSDFLNHLANRALKNQITTEEQQAKECFRKELETIAQKVVASAITPDTQLNPEHVQLKLYGSLGSGFGVAGSDMDLLLAFPRAEGSFGNVEIESRRMLEKAILDAGYGARLLTNTRVPILRVCQTPSPELLRNLRDYRQKWEESLTTDDLPVVDEGFGPLPVLTEAQIATSAIDVVSLDDDAHEVPLPASPIPTHSQLEYTGDCGIQCDINFSNYVALHNTRLLKTYGMCDPRVRQVGVFVKSWAKARDINTPYRGTLSSYGYILMVLHYLMNVVSPPIIPNLQDIAKQRNTMDGNTVQEFVEGFDVRFVRDMNEVKAIMQGMPRNHESVGSLLRGFFWYYSDPRGFHWNQDVISIRSRNGRLTKRSKGWTEAKWSQAKTNVRLRYLLAIEDPFELEHNVGRTVGHSGIVAIRDEFRTAWSTIENIQHDSETKSWFWMNQEGQKVIGDDMMAVIEHRGDLLRKDQNYHKKMRQMRLDAEAKEKELQKAATEGLEGNEEAGLNGDEASEDAVEHESDT